MNTLRLPAVRAIGWLCASLCIAALLLGHASAHAGAGNATWITVGDRTLERMRGGFDAGHGLKISFGIARVVQINGQLVATTSFNINDLAGLTPKQAQAVQAQLNTLNLVQNGPRNTYSVTPAAAGKTQLVPAVSTIVQNTLNDQKIETRTVIDISTNALSMIKGLNASGTLNDVMLRSSALGR